AMDDARVVGDAIVLSTLAYGDVSYARTPICAHVVAVDRATGKVRWTRARPKECGDGIVAASVGGVWYDDAKGKLSLLATADGATKADIAMPKGAAKATTPGRIWIAADGKATVYDDTTGAAIAGVALPNSKTPVGLLVTPEAVFAASGGGVVVLDRTSGAALATLPAIELRDGFFPRWVRGAAVVPTSGGELVTFGEANKELSRAKLSGDASTLAVIGGDVAYLDKTDVHAIDPATGAERFATALRERATGALAYAPPVEPPPAPAAPPVRAAKTAAAPPARPASKADAPAPPEGLRTSASGLVLVTTSTKLVAIDATSGQTLFSAKLPQSFVPQRASDEIFVTSDGATIVVANGYAFAAFRRATGEPAWKLHVRSFGMPMPGKRAQTFNHLATRANLTNAGDAAKTVERAEEARRNAQRPLEDGLSRKLIVLGTNVAQGGAATTANVATGVVGGMYGALDASFAKGAAWFVAGVVRAREHLETAMALSLGDRVGDYVMRPIEWPSGEGFIVLRLADGAFAEIATGPGEWTFAYHTMTSVAALSPADKTFVAVGPGLDPTKWRDDASQPLMHLLARSLLTFPLGDDAVHSASEYATRSLVKASDVP
ncbi:MAG TPA: PQQ-binding-like beta-propeller repeat protein, partial [Labilithrix sp.]